MPGQRGVPERERGCLSPDRPRAQRRAQHQDPQPQRRCRESPARHGTARPPRSARHGRARLPGSAQHGKHRPGPGAPRPPRWARRGGARCRRSCAHHTGRSAVGRDRSAGSGVLPRPGRPWADLRDSPRVSGSVLEGRRAPSPAQPSPAEETGRSVCVPPVSRSIHRVRAGTGRATRRRQTGSRCPGLQRGRLGPCPGPGSSNGSTWEGSPVIYAHWALWHRCPVCPSCPRVQHGGTQPGTPW